MDLHHSLWSRIPNGCGQQFIDGNWYYFDENGQAITGFKDLSAEENFGTPQTVYYDVNGQMVHGEKQIDGAIYYLTQTQVH